LYSLIHETDKEVIVAGDFNTFWGDKELKLFLAATGLEMPTSSTPPPTRAMRRTVRSILSCTRTASGSTAFSSPISSCPTMRRWSATSPAWRAPLPPPVTTGESGW